MMLIGTVAVLVGSARLLVKTRATLCMGPVSSGANLTYLPYLRYNDKQLRHR